MFSTPAYYIVGSTVCIAGAHAASYIWVEENNHDQHADGKQTEKRIETGAFKKRLLRFEVDGYMWLRAVVKGR